MTSKFKIGDSVICENRKCYVLDMIWVEHMDEIKYLIQYNSEFAEVLERDLAPDLERGE